jgi:hypothetical protein
MSTTYKRHKLALEKLNAALSRPALIVHYSCESFYDYTKPTSRRITSIAVRQATSSQTHSFSLHLAAEAIGKLESLEADIDACERKMLDQFFEFVKSHQNGYLWLHWNMRDSNYGFEAIEHRYSVLGGCAVQIPDASKLDLSPLLVEIYGKDYSGHPRIDWLVRENGIHTRALLTGAQEAEAYEHRQYVALHQSTLMKVQALAEIADLASRRKRKQKSKWRDIYGGSVADVGMALKDNWIWVLVTTVLGISLGAAGVILSIN